MTTVEQLQEKLAVIPDAELIEKVEQWVTKLCDTDGRAWSLRVPPDPLRDPDLLISELIRRFKDTTHD
jgi:hypothetical protein